jgi:hypothetical protein
MFNITPMQPRSPFDWRPTPAQHARLLWVFMVVIFFHWVEHLSQIYQIYALGWLPKQAGGMLGLWFPAINSAELLHTSYNALVLAGILLLLPGFVGQARRWWTVAAVAQTWHWFEHVLLQVQWVSGYYLFGAPQQISILQLWFPRPELHFMYNLIVFVPLMVAMAYHMRRLGRAAEWSDG